MAGEKNYENRVRSWLETVGIHAAGTPAQKMPTASGWYFKVWGGGFQKEGIPDLILCVNGIFIAVELKAERGRPSALQKKNIAHINRSGGIGIILYPKGFDDFKTIIREVLNCNVAIHDLNASISANSNTNCVIWMD